MDDLLAAAHVDDRATVARIFQEDYADEFLELSPAPICAEMLLHVLGAAARLPRARTADVQTHPRPPRPRPAAPFAPRAAVLRHEAIDRAGTRFSMLKATDFRESTFTGWLDWSATQPWRRAPDAAAQVGAGGVLDTAQELLFALYDMMRAEWVWEVDRVGGRQTLQFFDIFSTTANDSVDVMLDRHFDEPDGSVALNAMRFNVYKGCIDLECALSPGSAPPRGKGVRTPPLAWGDLARIVFSSPRIRPGLGALVDENLNTTGYRQTKRRRV